MLNYQAPLDLAFQALADPARRAIVDRLALGPASVSELAKPLPMSLPAVMLHLKVLEESGLVKSEKAGRVRTYELDPKAIRRAEEWMATRRAAWEKRLDQLDSFLNELKEQSE